MYKIPAEEEIGSAITKILEKYREVESQKLLHFLVLKKLKEQNQYYMLSEDRVRKIASKLPAVRIFVEKRKTDREAKKCYVCGSELETLKAKNLYGSEAAIGKKCRVCGFKMNRKNLMPRKYIFLKKS